MSQRARRAIKQERDRILAADPSATGGRPIGGTRR
jgi:hypothetical protein